MQRHGCPTLAYREAAGIPGCLCDVLMVGLSMAMVVRYLPPRRLMAHLVALWLSLLEANR